MIEIFEQGNGRGLGHSVDSFLQRFGDICARHAQGNRASKFALILYDFESNLRKLLNERGAFAEIDRLARNRITVFYLDSRRERDYARLKAFSVSRFGRSVEDLLPCIICFSVLDDNVTDITTIKLEAAEGGLAFHELYRQIEEYADPTLKEADAKSAGRENNLLTTVGMTVLTESLRTFVRDVLTRLHL
jgi:hypothetical protein